MKTEQIVNNWLKNRIKDLEKRADEAFEKEEFNESEQLELMADSIRRTLEQTEQKEL